MRSKSSLETRAARKSAMGADLGTLFDSLYNDVLWLQTKWVQLTKLYLHSSERTRALFGVAPFFFEVLRGVLWEDVLLHLARLTDPPVQFGHDNLSLQRLPGIAIRSDLVDPVEQAVAVAVGRASFAREYRNKHLAHADLGFALDEVEALPPVEPADVESVLEAFREVVNLLNEAYFGERIAIEDVWAVGDADSLIARLLA